MKVAVLSSCKLNIDGSFWLRTMSVEEAKALAARAEKVVSFIEDRVTAVNISILLEKDIKISRSQYLHPINQVALILKTDEPLPEGIVLSLEELQAKGAKFQVLIRLP